VISADARHAASGFVMMRRNGISMATMGGAIAAVENLGAQAGALVLRKGGNAADAAVACSFAQAVVDPWRCSIGGTAHIMYFDAVSGKTVLIDAGGFAPRRATDTMFQVVNRWENAFVVKDGINRWGYLAQVVPGFVRGMHLLYTTYGSGRISWSDLIAPSIEYAADGFPVHPHLAQAWARDGDASNPIFGDSYEALDYSNESRRIFLHEDGSVYATGEILRQPDLARTLESISQNGPDEFYEGAIAAAMAADFAEHGGLIDATDLSNYQPIVEEPIRGSYRGLEIVTQSAPSVGPTIVEILSILDGWNVGSWERNSAEHLRHLADTIYLAFLDRDENIADPRLVGDTFGKLLAPEHIASLRQRIESGRARPGVPGVAHDAPHDTTHVATMDTAGNACGITHSVGAGTGVITPGLGFMHNCHMTNYDPRPGMVNSIAPGKRGTGGGAPVFVVKDGRPIASVGSPAGTYKASAIPQVISNRFDFGLSLEESVSSDRIHVRSEPRMLLLERRFNPRVALEMAAEGYDVHFSDYGARVVGVERDPDTGQFATGSDARGDRGQEIVTAD
jgi:gamma-glutamyltranspeptidase/glutathione hydrolase